MISYAQNHEDVLLHRVLGDLAHGVYLDVGAAHPTLHSVTRAFYDRGWHGINVEPQADMFQLLCEQRPRDTNLQVGVADRSGQLPFYVVHPEGDVLGGLSTFDGDLAESYRQLGYRVQTRTIPVMTLGEICARHELTQLEFLKVDVEGFEAAVLDGMDWDRCRPRIVVIESTVPTSSVTSHELWEPLLLQQEYLFACFDGLNRYYLRREDAHLAALLQIPVNPLDRFVTYDSAQLRDVHQQLGSMTEGTDPQSLRWGLWLARRLHRVKRALRVI